MSIIEMSMSAGMLVASIILIRTIALNKLPKTMFLILWSIVLLRLLIPVSIPSRFSVYNYLENVVDKKIDNEIANINESSNGYAPLADQTIIKANSSIPWLTIVWIVGMSTVMIYFIINYIKSFNKLRFALPVCGNKFIDEWLKSHKLIRRIRILYSDRISTPIATGIIRPRIILPKFINMEDELLLKHVLMHEYCHIKRNDILWKLISAAVLCIYWFNPFVWVMFILACRDLELTCDEMVIRRLGSLAKASYAYSLISMSEKQSKLIPLHIGFGQNAAKERIVSVMKYKKTSFISIILAVSLIIGIPAVFAASAVQDKNEIDSQETDIYSEALDIAGNDMGVKGKDVDIYHGDVYNNEVYSNEVYNNDIYNKDTDIYSKGTDKYNETDLYRMNIEHISDDSLEGNEYSYQLDKSEKLANNEVNDSAMLYDEINKDMDSFSDNNESISDNNISDGNISDDNILVIDSKYSYMMIEKKDFNDSSIGTSIIVSIDKGETITESYTYDEWIKMLDSMGV